MTRFYLSRVVTASRVPTSRRVVPLTKQDPTLRNQQQIEEGGALISATLSKGSIGTYELQAAIAAVHDGCRERGY